jgi:hypothetical protein
MDENLTRHADSLIPGNCVILSGFKSKRNSRQNFSKFHTDFTQNGRTGKRTGRFRRGRTFGACKRYRILLSNVQQPACWDFNNLTERKISYEQR